MKLGIPVAVLVIGFAVASFIAWQPVGDRGAAPAPAPSAEPPPSEAPEEPEAPVPTAPPQPGAPAPAEAPAQHSAARPENKPAPTVVRPPIEPTGQVELLEGAYKRDPADPSAQQDEARIRALSGTEHVPVDTLRGVRCTKRVCRVEVRWSEEQPYGYMAIGMLMYQQFEGLVAMRRMKPARDDEKVVDLEIFMARAKYTEEELK